MKTQAQLGPLNRLVMPGPVAAAHAKFEAQCKSCHVSFKRQSQQTLCLDCHKKVAADLKAHTGFHGKSPKVQAAGTACASCHKEHRGRDADILGLDRATFDHGLTEFPLRGRHRKVSCDDCHAPGTPFHDAKTQCVACHAKDDKHMGRLGRQCADCHAATGWKDTHFDHAAATGYALSGAHAKVKCAACHAKEHYANTPKQCIACHKADDEHKGTNGPKCESCHTTAKWSDVRFDHSTATGFPLAGGHANLKCGSCHQGNKFQHKTPTACNACHMKDDVHKGVNGDKCGDCHRVTTWLDVTFDHNRNTDFALRGAHADLHCTDCHIKPAKQVKLGTRCIDCHAGDDPHKGKLGKQCQSCHNEQSFTKNVRFDHDLTEFPLLGRHAKLDCDKCHKSKTYVEAPVKCISCHAKDDAHKKRLGTDCGVCHNPNAWRSWVFNHATQTKFPLDGAHAKIACEACHRRPLEGAPKLSTDCASCHRGDDVHHGEFGRDCGRCHRTTSFSDLRTLQ